MTLQVGDRGLGGALRATRCVEAEVDAPSKVDDVCEDCS